MAQKTLEFIKSCVNRRKIFWTYHVRIRLRERLLSRAQILSSVNSFEIIEAYPEDKYLPSYLIYAKYYKSVIHIHMAIDWGDDNIRIITAYIPSSERWENDFKTRRSS